MAWLILAAAYLAAGLGVLAWCIRSNAAIDADQKKRSARTLVLFPELCLLWPLALFLEIKRNKKPNHPANQPTE